MLRGDPGGTCLEAHINNLNSLFSFIKEVEEEDDDEEEGEEEEDGEETIEENCKIQLGTQE